MNYWNHVLWSEESKLNLFGSDGVQHVWWRPGEEYQENCDLPTVKQDSIMALSCMTNAGTGSCGYWGKHGSQHVQWPSEAEDDALPLETTRWQLPCCWRWMVMEWPSISPHLNPIEHMRGILKRKVEKHHVSNIQQLRDVIMESGRGCQQTTCAGSGELPWPEGIKAVLDKPWCHLQIFDIFGTVWHVYLGCVLIFVASIWTNNGYMLSYI